MNTMTMKSAEQEIRDVITNWMQATAAGDRARILPLMAEDVVFLTCGNPPMRGRDAFAKAYEEVAKAARIESESKIQEIHVTDDHAYCWNYLTVKITPLKKDTAPIVCGGNVLSVFRREADGRWVIFRDANLLPAAK